MTNGRNILTKIGKNSMSAYIIHIFIVQTIRPLMKPYFLLHEHQFLVAIFIISFIIVYVFSRDFVSNAINKLTDSVFNLISYDIN